jgi:chemotaxis protein histidine kinase CheA
VFHFQKLILENEKNRMPSPETKPKIPETYLKRLLESSLIYHQSAPNQEKPIPKTFKNKSAAIKAFTQALHFEAHQSFYKKLDTTVADPMLHAVNLDKQRPGIVSNIKDDKSFEVFRQDTATTLQEKNTKLWEIRQAAEKANKVVDKLDKRTEKLLQKLLKKQEAHQAKQEEREAARLQKAKQKEAEKAQKKLQRERERAELKKATPVEKKLIREQRAAAKAQEKKRKEEEKKRLAVERDEKRAKRIAEKEAQKAMWEQKCREREEKKCLKEQTAPPIQKGSGTEKKNSTREVFTMPAPNQEIPLAKAAETENTETQPKNAETTNTESHSKNAKTTTTETQPEIIDIVALENTIEDPIEFYASPVTFNRHLGALSAVNPHQDLLPTILSGKAPKRAEACRMFLGPPGTGKTYRLIVELKRLLQETPESRRFYVCAGSNVGTANLYTRAKSLGVSGSLIMNMSKIPKGAYENTKEVKSWTTSDRVVFATVSSRSCYKLKDEEFHTVLLDEAAQLQESCCWGLLRPEVDQLFMSGDTNQLPAVVSEKGVALNHGRSLMERLVSLDLEPELLNTQRRMHPDIVAFPNEQFYQGKLKTAYSGKSKLDKPFQIVPVAGKQERVGTSYQNQEEVRKIKQLVKELQPIYDDIVIIAPYSAQCSLLKKQIPTIPVHTVDSFQGKEADVVILTTVRVGKSVGFWSDYRRLNVGLTRAKHGLRVVGDIATWKRQTGPLSEMAKLL